MLSPEHATMTGTFLEPSFVTTSSFATPHLDSLCGSDAQCARLPALALLHGEDAPVYRPSMYAWTEQFGLHIKMAGPPGPAGVPVTSEGSLEALSALLTWPSDSGLRQVIGVNHPAPPAKLKRMLGARQP